MYIRVLVGFHFEKTAVRCSRGNITNMKNWQSKISPYSGDEPYLYFAFAEADSAKVWAIIEPLLTRGCRIWFTHGTAGNSGEVLKRQERSAGATLTVLYLTDAACADKDTKSLVLVNQKFGRPILVLDPDGTDRRLSMGLRETVPHIPLYKLSSSEEKESAIIHAKGFSQDVIGTPVTISRQGITGLLTKVFLAVAILIALISLAGFSFFGWFKQDVTVQEDEIIFTDSAILSAVREAADGGTITEDIVSDITVLKLSDIPSDWNELSKLPSLEKIVLPQEAVMRSDSLPDGYTIALSGGNVS